MRPLSPTAWSDSDAHLALEAALDDRWLTPKRREELKSGVIALSMMSPKAFRRLCDLGKKPHYVVELLQRAYEATHTHPEGATFRAWLDKQAPGKAVPMPLVLSRSQRAAWAALEETAQLYFSGALRHARIQPRTSRLIAGPSGIGKSHLVRKFAEEHGWGFLPLTFGGWLPQGAREKENTAAQVSKFLLAHEHCVILIDELDKLSTELRSEWSVSIANDLYALLDRTWFRGTGPTNTAKLDLNQRLRENTFIIGAGTWQSLWSVEGGARNTIGFQKSAGAPMPDQIRAARVIATELLNRFNPELLLLEPMTAADFAEICRAESLEAQAAELGHPLDYVAAEASGLGMRWIESQVLKLHVVQAKQVAAANLAKTSSSIQSSLQFP